MPKKIDSKLFLEKLNKVHNSIYVYDKDAVISTSVKMKIVCKIHGIFYQLPHNHLKRGCPTCGKENSTKVLTKPLPHLLEQFQEVHKNSYDYSLLTQDTSSHKKIKIICKSHGVFEQTVHNHLLGKGCKVCAQTKNGINSRSSLESFVNKASDKHNSFYDYSESVYVTALVKLNIRCPIHGIFQQTPNKHLSGRGCPSCRLEKQGWSKTSFNQFCQVNNNGLGILYIIKCFNENETFYKIGITSKSIEERFDCISKMPYTYEVVQKILDIPNTIYELEHILHRLYKPFKYTPLTNFGGNSECFKL